MTEEEVLDHVKSGRVFYLSPDHFDERMMTVAEMRAIFSYSYFNAFWQYEDPPCAEKLHALLKSGLHSNGFIACRDVLKYPVLCELFAYEIMKVIERRLMIPQRAPRIDAVASSAYSAISLGWEVARFMSNKYNRTIAHVVVEKDSRGNPTVIRGGIDPGVNVLILNELMTTGGGSTLETRKAVLTCNGDDPAPTVLEPAFVLVHRSKDYTLADGSAVQPVFHFDIENFEPEECPYCKAGSEAIKPKVGDGTNWRRLHGQI